MSTKIQDEHDGFDEVKRINDKRRSLIKRSYLTGISILLHWNNTLFSSLLFKPELNLTIIVYAIGRVVITVTPPVTLLSLTAMAGSSTLVAFFLVFYVTQCYTRYSAQYDAAMGCKGRIFDTILLARTTMDKASAWRIFRYMNAAHVLGYIGLSDAYSETNLFNPVNQKYRLLTEDERQRVCEIGMKKGAAHREVLAWAIQSIHQLQADKRINDFDATTLLHEVCVLRGKMGQLYDFSDQPIPFSYIHFINVMIFVYLPLFALGVALNFNKDRGENHPLESIFGFLIVLFFSVAIICLKDLGQRLQEPWGDDYEDLSVLHFVQFNIEQSRKILLATHVELVSDEEEMELARERDANLADDAFPEHHSRVTPKLRRSTALSSKV